MPTPRIPNGFKPVIQGYNVGSPDGVEMTEVGGGMPRIGLGWDMGRRPFNVTFIIPSDQHSVWEVFYSKIIKNGSIQFLMPIDSGLGLTDHTCIIVPGSVSSGRAGGQIWSVNFTVLAQSESYGMSDEDAQSMIDIWNEVGSGTDALLARIEEFALEDTLVLRGIT